MGEYIARPRVYTAGWRVERSIVCINGLAAWFVIAEVDEPDEAEMGYSDGAIGSAEDRAKQIADALNRGR